uniref:Protein unc-93 homolog A n=1 Tax=Callorhinchus milii TaxID=7868 RepID=A0A4W3HTQ8_CALMI
MKSNLKNVLVVSLGFFLLFTAFGGLQNIQSSLNSDDGLGVASLGVIYGALIFSSLFVPSLVIKYLGCKWTITVSMCCYVAYTFGNFYASWYTLIPTAVILGLGGAPLWAAKCTYLTINGNLYAKQYKKIGKDVVNQYFGIFFCLFQFSSVLGNLISSLVFQQYSAGDGDISEETLKFCGAYDCPQISNNFSSNITVERPSNSTIYTLLGIYSAVGVLAVILVAVFLDELDQQEVKRFREEKISVLSVLLSTVKHLRDKRQCLLILLTIYSGLEQGFLSGDYTKFYVTCALGIQYVGYSMICFGASNAIFSFLCGKLAQYIGRIVLYILATLTNVALIIALLLWKPQPEQMPVFFVFPGMWGFVDAVWQTQTNALYGDLFNKNKEAAFANYRLWESVGFVIAFASSNYLCVYVKLSVLLVVLVIGIMLYGVVEYIEFKNSTPVCTYFFKQIKAFLLYNWSLCIFLTIIYCILSKMEKLILCRILN